MLLYIYSFIDIPVEYNKVNNKRNDVLEKKTRKILFFSLYCYYYYYFRNKKWKTKLKVI